MLARLVGLLAVAVVCAFTLAAAGTKPAPIPDSEAARLAFKLDRLLDKLPEPEVAVNADVLRAWTFEILPYFEYEGIIGAAIPPESVTLTPYLGAMEHNHILGRAYCSSEGGGPVEINARVGNPVSAWYGRPGFLATLVHELGHVQGGGLCSNDSALTESTTQLVTLEVLAAMANGGNQLALYGLLDELRDMLMGAVHYEALAGKVEGWRAFQARIYSTPAERARSEKSRRRWANDMPLLKEILFKYSYIPIQKVLKGLPKKAIPGLLLGEPAFDWSALAHGTGLKPRALVIDDLAYVIAHAGELAPEAIGYVGPLMPQGAGS